MLPAAGLSAIQKQIPMAVVPAHVLKDKKMSDIAEHQEQLTRNILLKKHKESTLKGSSEYCWDCGVKIPPERLKLIYAIRCFGCQTVFEIKGKKYVRQ